MSDQTIYVIQHEKGYSKIGVSESPSKRLQSLQCGSPYELSIRTTLDGICDEAEYVSSAENGLHGYYSNHVVRSEWFDLPDKHVDSLERVDRVKASELEYLVYDMYFRRVEMPPLHQGLRDTRVMLDAQR